MTATSVTASLAAAESVATERRPRAGFGAAGGAGAGRAFRLPAAVRAAAVVCVAAAALAGCGVLGSGGGAKDAAAATPGPVGSAAGPGGASAVTGFGSVRNAGDLPDPCTLLSEDEVSDLTGRAVTQIDRDDAEPGDPTRFCQWQQDGGQLALFIARTTREDFAAQTAEATPVDGVGDDAFHLAGHLYVLYGSLQIDVYARGASDDRNLADAKEVAKAVFPRI